MTLLPKERAPDEFTLLRPTTVLESASKWFSRLMLQAAEPCDVGSAGTGLADACMMGFRKIDQCTDSTSIVHGTIEKRTDWDIPLFLSRRCGTPCTGEAFQCR